jgi:GT2 family glycosyltransferase
VASSTGIDAPVGARVLDVEMSRPPPDLEGAGSHSSSPTVAWLLVRLFGEPIGWHVLEIPEGGLSGSQLADVLSERWAAAVGMSLGCDAGVSPAAVREAARRSDGTEFARAHEAAVRAAERCAVVVCTRNNEVGLRRCLASLAHQDHRNFIVWVVDNAPQTSSVRSAVEEFSGRMEVRYLPQPVRGLSRARNTAVRHDLDAGIVAWLDDDEVADELWLSELARAFSGRPEVAAVSGVVVPAELATQEQMWFEQFGGHSKGRGFTVAEFSPASRNLQSPFYPLPPFGVGANMAFRLEALREVGGFDEALGAGTGTRAGEDTLMFTEILHRGGTSLYWPTALTRHFHRRDRDALTQQMYAYGCGLTAYYTALVLKHPAVVPELVRLTARAWHDMRSTTGPRHASIQEDFPPELLTANRRGMLAGPASYVAERIADRRRGKRTP